MPKSSRYRPGLRSKIALVVGATALVNGVVFVAGSAYDLKMRVEPAFHERGASVARYVAARLAAGGVTPGEYPPVVASLLRSVPDAAYVTLRAADGRVLASAALPGLVAPDPGPAGEGERSRDLAVAGVSLHEVVVPVPRPAATPAAWGDGPAVAASVQLGVRRAPLDDQLAADFRRAAGLAAAFVLLAAALAAAVAWGAARRLRLLRDAAASLAIGDFDRPIDTRGKDEVADLARSFAAMSSGFADVARELNETVDAVQRESSTILATATQQASAASQQARSIQETNTTVERLARTAREAREQVDVVLQRADRFLGIASEGEEVVGDTMKALDQLGEQVRMIAGATAALEERTRQIEDVIEVAEELAEESNLLALNAAIEASKAGDHGLGFGVVAQEMRGLAEGSKAAAGRIRMLLSDIQRGTTSAVAATGEGSRRAEDAAGSAAAALARFRTMAEEIREGADAARRIAEGSRHQGRGVETIAAAISDLSKSTAETLAGAARIEKTAGALDAVAKRLTEVLGRYRV